MPVRIQLHGGLGNQLFIWAMARTIVTETNSPVELVFFHDKKSRSDRPIELLELVSKNEGRISIHQSKCSAYALKAVDKISATKGLRWINPSNLLGIDTMEHTYDIPSSISKTKLLRGFFQNATMVDSQKDTLSFELNKYLNNINLPLSSKEMSRNIVLHIRRGDSIKIAKEWGLLEYRYYKRNLNYFDDVTILTDDESFLPEIQAHFPESEILTPRECSSWQALKIMAFAKHLVMANSTLSWWGGWLLTQNKGICTFPYPWRPGNIEVTEKLILAGALLANSDFPEK